MKIGLISPLANPFATPEFVADLGQAVEERGFHSLWVPEHVVLFDEYESKYPYAADGKIPLAGESGPLDPFVVLSFLAANTKRIRLGTGVCLLPQRNPVYTAKEATCVDWLSNGRFDFGIGVGWLAEEFAALQVPFDRRGARAREYVEVMRRLWCDPISTHEGEFYRLPPCRQYPKPVQRPHPPIHFGGESDAALKRVADLGQGWYGFRLTPEDASAHLAVLDRLLSARGRKRSELQISITPPWVRGLDKDKLERYRDAGIDQIIVMTLVAKREDIRRVLDSVAVLVR